MCLIYKSFMDGRCLLIYAWHTPLPYPWCFVLIKKKKQSFLNFIFVFIKAMVIFTKLQMDQHHWCMKTNASRGVRQ